MNEYLKQAIDFLNLTGTQLSINLRQSGVANTLWDDGGKLRNTYNVVLSNYRSKENIIFWDSIYNHEHNIQPNEYDVLACITKYDPHEFDDFAQDFGYIDSPTSRKIYNMCVEEYAKITRLFSDWQIELLQDIQ